MRYGILGPVEAWRGRRALALGGPRQLTLLAFLLLHADRAVSADELIDAVWGSQRDGAAKRLSVAVARLRRALEPLERDGVPVLRTVGGGYRLSLSDGDLDAQRFEALSREGREALEGGDAPRAQRLLREALELWRGPALAQVSFEAFAQVEARRLEELRLLAWETRIDADLQVGEDRALVGELEALLSAHPTRERLAGQLMLALYRCGRQADALEVYRRTRSHLRDELGLEPGKVLRELEAQILDQTATIAVGAGAGWELAAVPQTFDDPVTMVIAEAHDAFAAAALQLSGALGRDPFAGMEARLRAVWERHGAALMIQRSARMLATFSSPAQALLAALEAAEITVASVSVPASVPGAVSALGPVAGALRVGVHTGQLRISHAGFWGEDVHYAARLADAAHPGQILVSAATAVLLPDAALTDLGEHRLTDDLVPGRLFGLGAGPHLVPRGTDPLRSNLPRVPGQMIGRELEQAELTQALHAGEARLLTITGPGGSGKTRLALSVAESAVEWMADGAFFLSLAQVGEAGGVAASIAAALGIQLSPGSEPADPIARGLSDRQLLLVLDNFEHLLDAAPLITELLARAPHLRVLVTSQAPLRVRGERVLALGPLQVPRGDDQTSVAAAAAGRLLIERAREADPSFALTDDNAQSLAALCRALGGLPLAIELAAARLTLLSSDQLLARLDQGLDAIGRGPRDLPERQRGLRAALDWTHALLSEEDAKLLRRLGVFAGPVPLERIERVCGGGNDLLDPLSHLVDLSLVTRAPDGRLLLHATVRAYAREKLLAAGEEHELARRHAQAHADAAMVWGNRFLFDVGTVHSAVLREEADITQALTWAAAHDQDCFARLAGGASMPLHIVARLLPWSEMIEQALIRDAVSGASRAWLLLAASLVAFERGDQRLARARLDSTIVAAQEADDPWLVRLMRSCSIIFHVLTGATEGVREEHTLLTRTVADLRDREFTELVRGLEAYVLGYCEGRYAEAGALWAAQIADRSRTDFAGWTALYCWPDCPLLDGDHQTALEGFRAALLSARERGQSPTVAYQLEGMAMALSGLGRHEQALEAAGWADSVRRTTGPAPNTWYAATLDRAVAHSRDALDAGVAEAAYARGRALTLDAAVNAALRLGLDEPAAVELVEPTAAGPVAHDLESANQAEPDRSADVADGALVHLGRRQVWQTGHQ